MYTYAGIIQHSLADLQVCSRMHVYVRVCVCVCVYLQVCSRMHVYIYICVCVCIYIYNLLQYIYVYECMIYVKCSFSYRSFLQMSVGENELRVAVGLIGAKCL
jgi:hypothetical protein